MRLRLRLRNGSAMAVLGAGLWSAGILRAKAHGGHEHLAVPGLSWWDWQWEWPVLGGLGALALAGVLDLWKARPQSAGREPTAPARQAASAGRLAWWLLGLATVAVALESPLDRGADRYLFTLHMVQHMLLAMVAAPLLALGMPQGAARLAHGRVIGGLARFLWHPVVAGVLYNAAMAVWHLPGPYEAALRMDWLHAVQHLSFLGSGVLFWSVVLRPHQLPLQARPADRLALVVASAVLNWLVSFALAAPGRMIYPTYAAAPRLWGLSPEADMALGAGIMWEHGNMVYALAVLRLLRREWLRAAPPQPALTERAQPL